MARDWISREEALVLLDVKPQTLYAYVSRQRIAARADPENPRLSLYARDDVEALAKRAPGRAPGHIKPEPSARIVTGGSPVRGESSLDSDIGVTIDGIHYYRGRSMLQAAERETFETVCAHLWKSDHPNPFGALKPRPDVNFPGGPRTRALHMLSRRLEEDTPIEIKTPRPLLPEAAGLLNELIDALTNGGPRLYFHQRLARAWKVLDPKDIDLVRRALILTADFELDDATIAVRAAMGSQGSLASGLMAGFSTAMGPRLGGRLSRAEGFVSQILRIGNPAMVAKSLISQGLSLPGFENDTPSSEVARAKNLIAAAEHMGAPLRVIGDTCEELSNKPMGLSLALALIGRHLDLPRDAPLTLYCVGRCAGWLAHAMEHLQTNSRLRVRLRFIGNNPLLSNAS